MTIQRVATCDAPHCNREYALNDKFERDGMPVEAGWFNVGIGAAMWHFCSFTCLNKWSMIKASEEETTMLAKKQQVGTSQHHGTKMTTHEHKGDLYGS